MGIKMIQQPLVTTIRAAAANINPSLSPIDQLGIPIELDRTPSPIRFPSSSVNNFHFFPYSNTINIFLIIIKIHGILCAS